MSGQGTPFRRGQQSGNCLLLVLAIPTGLVIGLAFIRVALW